MLIFRNPIAFTGLLALVIPVLVHLWHISKGKTLKVGSTRLYTIAAKQRASRRRIHNWPLFLIRCLLVIMCTMLLAQPEWKTKNQHTTNAAWILVPAAQLSQTYREFKPEMDSLLGAGATIHAMDQHFSSLSLEDTAASAAGKLTEAAQPWQVLARLDQQLPAGFPVYVYSTNELALFRGKRPQTRLSLHWTVVTNPDSNYLSEPQDRLTSEGNVVSLQWISSPSGNYYKKAQPAGSGSIDSSIIQVAVVAGNNRSDAKYIEAALDAVSSYTGLRINVTEPAAKTMPDTKQDLVFYLADEKPVDRLSSVADHGSLFIYRQGTVIEQRSLLDDQAGSISMNTPSLIYKRVAGPLEGSPVWTSGGEPILSHIRSGNKNIYEFAGRFNPDWGDQVWDERLVTLISSLLVKDPKDLPADKRLIDLPQVLPATGAAKETAGRNYELLNKTTELSDACWLVVFLLFIIERLIFWKQNRVKNIVPVAATI